MLVQYPTTIQRDPLTLTSQILFALYDVLSHSLLENKQQSNQPFTYYADEAELKATKRVRVRQMRSAADEKEAVRPVSKADVKRLGKRLTRGSRESQQNLDTAVDTVWCWLEEAKIPYLVD